MAESSHERQEWEEMASRLYDLCYKPREGHVCGLLAPDHANERGGMCALPEDHKGMHLMWKQGMGLIQVSLWESDSDARFKAFQVEVRSHGHSRKS